MAVMGDIEYPIYGMVHQVYLILVHPLLLLLLLLSKSDFQPVHGYLQRHFLLFDPFGLELVADSSHRRHDLHSAGRSRNLHRADELGMEDNSTVECLFTVQWYPRVVLVIMYEIILLLRGHAWPNFIRLCSSSLAAS